MKGRRSEKLTEHFMGPYKIKGIIFSNAKPQIEGQKKILPKPVIIEGQEEFEVEKILNKRAIREKKKFLVRWKGYIVEEDTWKNRENLENAKELVEEFKRKYREEIKKLKQQELEKEEKKFSWELSREFMAKLLYGWGKKRYKREREKRWDKNWNQWKNSSGRENLKGRLCYESSKREIVSQAFEHLI